MLLPRSISPASGKPSQRAKLASRWAPPIFLITIGVGLVWLFPREERTRQQALELQNDPVATEYLRSILQRHPDDNEVRIEIARRAMLAGDGSAAISLQPLMHNAPTAQRRQVVMLVVEFYENQFNSIPQNAPERTKALSTLQAALGQALATLSSNEMDPVWLEDKLQKYSPDWLNQLYYKQAVREPGRAPFWLERAAKDALANSRYQQAANAYFSAQQASQDPAHRKQYFLDGIRTLQSGNLLNEALVAAAQHETPYLSDRAVVFYLIRLARAAGNQQAADRYARKLMQLSLLDSLPPIQRASWNRFIQPEESGPVRWLRTAGTAQVQPFDEEAYTLSYDVFVGNRKLDDAMAVAQTALKHVPNQPNWLRRLAQVAEWSGHPDIALDAWRQLAVNHNDRAGWQGLARLAPGLLADEDLLLLWQEKTAKSALDDKEWRDVQNIYERLARPLDGATFFEKQFETHKRPLLLEQAAYLRNSMGDVDGALRNYRRLANTFGPQADWAITEATMLYTQGKPQQAFKVMEAAKSKVPDKNTAFWRVLGDLAWDLNQRETAKESYTRLQSSPDWQSDDTDRLLDLLDAGQTEERLALSRAAWKKTHNLIYLNTALGILLDRNQLAASRAILAEMTPQELQEATKNPDFLALRARHYLLATDWTNARADLIQAHALDPSPELEIDLIWLLIDTRDSATLSELLPQWESHATGDTALTEAIAAGWQSLGNIQRALPWSRQLLAEHGNDPAWLSNYAELIEQSGQEDLALRLRRQAWQALEKQPVGDIETLQHKLRLSLALEPVDPAEARLYRALLAGKNVLPGSDAPERDAALIDELAYAWFLGQDDDNRVHYWHWRRYARKLADPGYLALRAASSREDRDTQQHLQERNATSIQPADHTVAADETRERKIAQEQAWVAQDGAPDNDGLHLPLTDLYLADRPSRISLRNEYTSGDLNGWSTTLAGEVAVSPTLRLGLALSNAPVHWNGIGYSQNARSAEITLSKLKDNNRALSFTAGSYQGWKNYAGVALRDEWQYGRWLFAGEAGWNRPTDDNTELTIAGMQRQLAIEGGYQLDPTLELRLRLSRAQLLGQDTERLGNRNQADLSLSWASERRGDFSAELIAQRANYRPRNTLLPSYAVFTTDGETPTAGELLPPSYGRVALTLGYGMVYQEEYTRAWRPFGSVTIGHHSVNGQETGWQLGIAGSVLGNDHLSIYGGSSLQRSGGNSKFGGIFYQWFY